MKMKRVKKLKNVVAILVLSLATLSTTTSCKKQKCDDHEKEYYDARGMRDSYHTRYLNNEIDKDEWYNFVYKYENEMNNAYRKLHYYECYIRVYPEYYIIE